MTAASPKPEPEAPARITEDHVRTRHIRNADNQIIIGEMAWSKLTKLEQTFQKDKLEDPDDKDEKRRKFNAFARNDAGKEYHKLWLKAWESGRNHLSREPVNGMVVDSDLPPAASAARARLEAINEHLGTRDRQIIRMVCGEDTTPSTAIIRVAPGYRDRVLVRFREALDALIEAMETSRRIGRRK